MHTSTHAHTVTHPHLPFLLRNILQALLHKSMIQWLEAKPGAPGLQGRDDFIHIITNKAKAGVAGVLFNNCVWRADR